MLALINVCNEKVVSRLQTRQGDLLQPGTSLITAKKKALVVVRRQAIPVPGLETQPMIEPCKETCCKVVSEGILRWDATPSLLRCC